MKTIPKPLPDSPEELKKIILQMQEKHEKEIQLLQTQVTHLYDKLFGPKSEKITNNKQLYIFDMPEPNPDEDENEAQEQEPKKEVKGYTRKDKARKPLPKELPRIELIHDIHEDEKVCACGAELSRIGEETSEKLDIKPAVIRVIRHIRPKYACKCCEGVEDESSTVKIAPVPAQVVPKGIASGGLIAHILTAKFGDGLPFYRQEGQFKRLGVTIHRNSMCSWAMKLSDLCQPLIELLHKDILSGPLINIDETTLQVLKEPDRKPQNKSYMWVLRGGSPSNPSLLYHYNPSRAGKVVSELLEGYKGAVQSDGYSGYGFLDLKSAIDHLGCWAHARRKFIDADKGRGKNAGKVGSATMAINFIGKIYALEKRFKKAGITGDDLVESRLTETTKILDKFKLWLDKKDGQVLAKSLMGKAITYTLNQWHRLVLFVNQPNATPDNNLAENAIRPFVIGRKNWLFAGSPDGATASANIYSLIESAKASDLDCYSYLRYLCEKIPTAEVEEDYKKLLPKNLSKDDLLHSHSCSVV